MSNMNKQLIERVIKANNEPCPEFAYENPLLDRNVTNALSKSFIKILNVSNQNSHVNNNLRLSILENIRKLCQTEPEGHLKVDDNIKDHLTNLYDKHIQELGTENEERSTAKRLDEFLVRKNKGLDINSSFESSVNPEVVQALINLNSNGVYLETLLKDILHWNTNNYMYSCLLKDMWNNSCENKLITPSVFNNICIKMKQDIETILLKTCHDILAHKYPDIRDVFSANILLADLTKKCSISLECFQICCNVLNFVFIMTNFDYQMQKFVPVFIEHVKNHCPQVTFSVLYPIHLSPIVVLLDFETDVLNSSLKNEYIQPVINYLHKLQSESENDLILLLSHFPQWFDIYFNHKEIACK